MDTSFFGMMFLIAAFAVKQIAAVIIEGSIFGSMRKAIKVRAEAGSYLFEKLRQLTSCKLCCTSQSAIWTIGIPAGIIVWNWHFVMLALPGIHPAFEFLLIGLGSFVLSMAVGAASMMLWNFAEAPYWASRDRREIANLPPINGNASALVVEVAQKLTKK